MKSEFLVPVRLTKDEVRFIKRIAKSSGDPWEAKLAEACRTGIDEMLLTHDEQTGKHVDER